MKRQKGYILLIIAVSMVLALVQPLSPYVDKISSIAYNIKFDKYKTYEKVFAANEGKKSSITSDNINDPLFSSEWYINQTESSKVWPLINQKREIRVAVVDTGVDYNHPDLKNKVLKDLGYDFYNEDKDPMDDGWHGTHIAGIIAAEAGNGIGISGITGPLDVKIIPVKVMSGNGEGPSDTVARGIKYSVDKGADIINLSIDFDVKDKLISDAIKYARKKGVFVVVSAGNDNRNCDYSSPTSDFGAFTVSSVNSAGEKSYFSNFGSSVKVAAPGQAILSTLPGGLYGNKDGTSMAAPMAAGIAAMLKAQDPTLTPEHLTNLLTDNSVQAIKSTEDQPIGKGIINADKAFQELMANKTGK